MRFEPFALEGPAFRDRLERLRFEYSKWDVFVDGKPTVAPGSLVLDPREHAELVAASEALADLSRRTRERLAQQPEDALALGIPTEVAALASADPRGPAVTRIDLFQTSEGWMASEFNEDVPGGFNEALGLPAAFHDVAPHGTGLAGDLPDALTRVLVPGEGAVGLLYATGYSEDLQVVCLLAELLRAHDVDVVLGSPANVEAHGDRVALGGHDVNLLYRFFPAEWFPLLPNASRWRAHEAWDAPLVNPFSCAWTQSKAVFAWLHEHAQGADRATVARHLPPTVALDETTAAAALDEPAAWVLKPAFGRMGEGVALGGLLPRDVWAKRVRHALRDRRAHLHVLQRRFHAQPLEVGADRTATVCVGTAVLLRAP